MSIGVLRQIASETTGTETTFNELGTADVQLCQANPLRYSLAFAVDDISPVFVTTQGSGEPDRGIRIEVANLVLLTVKDYGSLVQKPWFALGGKGAYVITVFELVFNKDT